MFKRFLPWFVLVALLNFALRFTAITFDSLYLDESYQSMYESTGQPLAQFMSYRGEPILFKFDKPHSLPDLFQHFREVDPLCPPLYGVLLNRWRLAFGSSDLALRGFSTVWSVLSNITLMTMTAVLFGGPTAIFAGMMQALSPFDVTYGQEVRMYSLELFLATFSTAMMVWLIRDSKTRSRLLSSALYAVSVWALINTHYTAMFTVVFQVLFVMAACWRRRDVKLLGWLAGSGALCLLLWLPWFGYFWQAASHRNGSFYVSRAFSWMWPITALFLRIPLNWACFLSSSHLPWFLTPLYLTSAVVLTFGIAYAIKQVRVGQKDDPSIGVMPYYLLLSWILVPSLILWALDVVETRKVLEFSRYLIAITPGVYILAGIGVVRLLKRRKPGIMLFLLSHAFLAIASIAYYHAVPQRRDWRSIARAVEQKVKPDDLVFVSHYYNIVCLDRYLDRPYRQIGLSPEMGAQYTQKVIRSFANLSCFWLVAAEGGKAIVPMLPREFKPTEEVRYLHDLHLFKYVRSPKPDQ
ncbi:MAG TPA: glycosyltransferase family 39 protein [Planktothrix sp.]